jgi:hypothetical protein
MITFLRSFRVGPFAIFDFTISYVAMYFFAPYLSKLFALIGITVNREQWLWLTLPISIFAHVIFQVNSPFTKMFFSPDSGWTAKIIIIFMLLMVYIHK